MVCFTRGPNCRHFWEYFEKRYDSLDSKSASCPALSHSFVATKARQWRPVFDASVSDLPTRMNWHDEWIPLEDIRMDQNRPVMPVHTMELASFCVSPSQRRVFSPKRSFRLIRRPGIRQDDKCETEESVYDLEFSNDLFVILSQDRMARVAVEITRARGQPIVSKVDVEGHEWKGLKGALEYLAEIQISHVAIEWSHRRDSNTVKIDRKSLICFHKKRAM